MIKSATAKFELNGFNLVVTGAGSGIGRQTAIECAMAGATGLALIARSKDDLESTASAISELTGLDKKPEVLIYSFDVSNQEGRTAFVEDLSSKWSKVHTLVNNAFFAIVHICPNCAIHIL